MLASLSATDVSEAFDPNPNPSEELEDPDNADVPFITAGNATAKNGLRLASSMFCWIFTYGSRALSSMPSHISRILMANSPNVAVG